MNISLQQKTNPDLRLGNHVLFVFIGAQRELVTLHSNLLPEAVKAYINERSVGQQLYQLPEDDVTLFQIYRMFLYSGNICSIGEGDQLRPDNGRAQAHPDAEWTRLAHLYIFGKGIGDEKFANACIDAIIEKMTESDRYPTGIASEVYQFTPAGDKLRKLLVDVHVRKGLGKWVKRPHDDADGPMEFLQDVIQGLATAGEKLYDLDWVMPWEATTCFYHTHRGSGRCGD